MDQSVSLFIQFLSGLEVVEGLLSIPAVSESHLQTSLSQVRRRLINNSTIRLVLLLVHYRFSTVSLRSISSQGS